MSSHQVGQATTEHTNDQQPPQPQEQPPPEQLPQERLPQEQQLEPEAETSQDPHGHQIIHSEHIEPASDPSDDGYSDGGSDRSSLTSLSSEILRGVTENGRTYASYGKEEYGMPMDEKEMDRIDMSHAKYYMLLDKRRFLCPVEQPSKIIDLGCGTGIWSIDVADEFPSAEVIGVDIAQMQPAWVPPNCRFEIDDVEQDWTWKQSSFDLVFARDLLFSIRDFPRLIRQAYAALKPGGYLELQSIYGHLGCDDDSLPANAAFRRYDQLIREAAIAVKTPLDDPGRYLQWFEEAGFELCVEQRFKIPSNPWPRDKKYKLIGLYEMENFLGGLEGMSLRLFQKGLGWSSEETTVFLASVRKEIQNVRYHPYYPFYVVYGRKPLNAV